MRYDLLLQPMDPTAASYDDAPLHVALASRQLKTHPDGSQWLCLPSGEVEVLPLVEGGRKLATQLRVPLTAQLDLVREAFREGLALATTAGLRLVDPQMLASLTASDEAAVLERFSRTAGDAAGQAGSATTRGVAKLHRDVWRTVLAAPAVFLGLPLASWLALDTAELGLGSVLPPGAGLQSALGVADAACRFLLEAWLLSVLLSTTKLLAAGGDVRLLGAIRAGNATFSRVLSTSWSATWRVTLGLALCVVPGVVLAARYALALPVAVFGDSWGSKALGESEAYVQGQWWRLFGYGTAMSMIYAYVAGLPGTCLALLDVKLGSFGELLVASPVRVVLSLLTIEAVLIYADTRADSAGRLFLAPIGVAATVPSEASVQQSPGSSGRLGLTVAILLAVVAAAAQAYLVPVRLQQAMEEVRRLKPAEQ